jgi:superfamily II DNA or RNA helicase
LAGPIIFTYPIQEGVSQGYLSAGVVVCLEFHDPLPKGKAPGYWSETVIQGKRKKIWIESGSTDAEYRYRIVLNKARNDCVESLVREGLKLGKRIVVLAERKLHLKILASRFGNIPHAVASGDVHSSIRLQAMKDMDAGKLSLILASRVFSKGVNVKTVDCIIDATALPGRNSAIQRYGRGVRTAEGKASLLYIDISDVGKFGFTSKQRKAALRETGAEIVDRIWGRAKDVFN